MASKNSFRWRSLTIYCSTESWCKEGCRSTQRILLLAVCSFAHLSKSHFVESATTAPWGHSAFQCAAILQITLLKLVFSATDYQCQHHTKRQMHQQAQEALLCNDRLPRLSYEQAAFSSQAIHQTHCQLHKIWHSVCAGFGWNGIFFTIACMVLCFGLMINTGLITGIF